jgi:hypothetical protein
MKYAVEIGSAAMKYIPSFIKIGSGIQTLMDCGYTDTDDHISLLLFSENKKSKLKINISGFIEDRNVEPVQNALRYLQLFL